uniref:Retroviral polymerase SH3-like domain-containing protein n=1 Tax=Tanacetum cinerariifolium TaxID=118510 RepID=A0A6L2K0W8_TANCI|nr:hypothetical protein [Tanacetum cinerariifolium]
MESVKKSIDKRALHKREYDSWVIERQMQTIEEKGNTSKALDASLVDTESSGMKSKEQDTSSRISKPQFASQVDVNNDLSKPVTTHYLPKERKVTSAKPQRVIASSESRNRLKNMPRFSSNDMVHNHYLSEAKKKTQENSRNSKPSVNLCTKVLSNKTTNRNKPIEQTSVARKPERQIPKGHRFPIKKTSVVHEKIMTPRSCLRWKPTEHPSDTKVSTMKMEILLEPTSNKLLDHLGKFNAKVDDGYVLRYSFNSKAFRIFTTRRQQIEKTYHVTFDKSMEAIRNSNVSYYIIPYGRSLIELTQDKHVPEVDIQNEQDTPHTKDVEESSRNNIETSIPITEPLVLEVPRSQITQQSLTSSYPVAQERWSRDQHIELVNMIGDHGEGMLTRSMAATLTVASASECLFVDFLSKIESKKVSEALKHPGWVDTMQEELNQFYRNIEEETDDDETFTPGARMKAIRIFRPDLAGKPVNETLYKGMIGSLMYLTSTRPDI